MCARVKMYECMGQWQRMSKMIKSAKLLNHFESMLVSCIYENIYTIFYNYDLMTLKIEYLQYYMSVHHTIFKKILFISKLL